MRISEYIGYIALGTARSLMLIASMQKYLQTDRSREV